MKSPKQPIGEEALSAWNAGVKEAADVHAAKLVKFMGVARSVGLSHVEIARRLNDAQHFSSASNPWSKNAVQRLAKRLKALALSEPNWEDSTMLSTIGPLDDETSVHGSPDADGRARAAVYIDSASENTLLRHRGLVETWTVRNQFQIVREFHDAMVGKRRLDSLVDALCFCALENVDLVTVRTPWLLRNSRFLKVAVPASRWGVNLLSADLEVYYRAPPELNRLFWKAALEAGGNWIKDPGGGRRDGTILTKDEKRAVRFLPQLQIGKAQGWSDAESARHLDSIGEKKPGGYPYTANDVRGMLEIVDRLYVEIVGTRGLRTEENDDESRGADQPT